MSIFSYIKTLSLREIVSCLREVFSGVADIGYDDEPDGPEHSDTIDISLQNLGACVGFSPSAHFTTRDRKMMQQGWKAVSDTLRATYAFTPLRAPEVWERVRRLTDIIDATADQIHDNRHTNTAITLRNETVTYLFRSSDLLLDAVDKISGQIKNLEQTGTTTTAFRRKASNTTSPETELTTRKDNITRFYNGLWHSVRHEIPERLYSGIFMDQDKTAPGADAITRTRN